MIKWIPLESEQQLDLIRERSKSTPCLIFKHSTRCDISAMAKYRLEAKWQFKIDEIEPYYLDLLRFRPISQQIAEQFAVHHESPQALLIYKSECIYDASHLDISVDELSDLLADTSKI